MAKHTSSEHEQGMNVPVPPPPPPIFPVTPVSIRGDHEKEEETTTYPGYVEEPNSLANGALTIGIAAFATGIVPYIGSIIAIIGIITGIMAFRRGTYQNRAVGGIALSTLALITNVLLSVALTIGILSAGIGAVLTGDAIQEAAKETNKTLVESNKKTEALVNARKEFTLQETAVFGDLSVKINTVQRHYLPADNTAPAEGKEFIVLNTTIKNISTDTEFLDPADFEMNNGGVLIYIANPAVETPLLSKDLKPGESSTGNLIYEVNAGSEKVKLQYIIVIHSYTDGKDTPKTLTYTIQL